MRISELPQDIKELALLRQSEEKDTLYSKTTDDLEFAFKYSFTEEGHKFWIDWFLKENPKNCDKIIAIIEKKIATMSSRGFESYYLPLAILKDLIREIKDIK